MEMERTEGAARDVAGQLRELCDLKNAGALDESEFKLAKQKLLQDHNGASETSQV
jgi:hypothetical protein